MQLEWNDEQRAYRERFRRFAEKEVAPRAAYRDQAGIFDQALWDRLAELSFWRLHVAQKYGGHGGTLWDFLAAFEGLAEGAEDFGFIMSVIAHAGLLRVVLDYGTERQRNQRLPLLTSGGVGATAATEPSGGSHVTGVKTSAQLDGDAYLLTGEKSHITNAPIADLILIVGRIPSLGQRDITLFLLDRNTPGISLGPPEDLMGQRSSPTGSILLQDVHVVADDIIGEPGDGLGTLYSFLAFDRLLYGVAVAGCLRPVLSRSLEQAHNRTAFGSPIAEYEYIQEKIVDMKLTMEASRWLAYSAAAALYRGDSSYSLQASLAKLLASEGMVRAGLEFIQLFGHAGYDRTTGIERVLRDAIALRIAGGTTEMQKKNIFKQLVNEHLVLSQSASLDDNTIARCL